MAETLTTVLKTDTVRMFFDDLQENQYYVFVSSVSTQSTDVDVVNSVQSKNEFLDKVLFGKKILNTDCKFMVKYYPWQAGQIFTQYDDRVDLASEKFYAVVGPNINDTGDYRVYKCLYNNEGAGVETAPNFNATTVDQIYRTADGYIWKYMYKLTQAEFEAYNAVGYIPVVDDLTVAPFDFDANTAPNTAPLPTTTGSTIDQIFVENASSNSGYPRATGTLQARPGNDGTIVIQGSLQYPLNEITNYYSGMSVTITDSQGRTRLYTCSTYTYDTDAGTATIQLSAGDDPLSDGVNNGAAFEIVPRIDIVGNGSGAKAIPVVDDDSRITSVLVLEKGSGYHTVQASVVDPGFDFNPDDPNSIDLRATIRPIMSPKGGHNTDRIEELACRHILLYGYITENDNNRIGATNTYSHLGIVKAPEWQEANTALHNPDVFDNRIAIVTDDYASVTVDSVLIQTDSNNNTTFSAKVHQIDPSANTIYLYNYNTIYTSTANNDVALDYSSNLITDSNVQIRINTPVANNVIESPYTQRSGLVYFMEDFAPLERTQNSREEYKLLLEF